MVSRWEIKSANKSRQRYASPEYITQPSTKLEGIEVPLKLNSEQFDSKNLLLQNEVFQMSKQIEGTLYILIKFPIFRKHRRRRNFSWGTWRNRKNTIPVISQNPKIDSNVIQIKKMIPRHKNYYLNRMLNDKNRQILKSRQNWFPETILTEHTYHRPKTI